MCKKQHKDNNINKTTKPKNILGMDFGTKQIGLALYYPDKDMIFPLKTIRTKTAYRVLQQIIDQYNINTLLIGQPRLENIYKQAREFANSVQQKFGKDALQVVFVNEDYTTASVKDEAKILGKRTRQIKKLKQTGIIDSLSAVKILELAREGGII